MTETYVFEHGVVILCQCLPLCRMPFRDETAEWSVLGCLKPKGHEPPCSAEGPDGGFAYRDPPEAIGMRVVFRRDQPGSDLYRGTCPRCLRQYALAVTSFSAQTAEVIASDNYDAVAVVAPNEEQR